VDWDWKIAYQKTKPWFNAVRTILETASNAKTMGPLGTALGGAAAIGTILETLIPPDGAWETLERMGLFWDSSSIDGFCFDVLMEAGGHERLTPAGGSYAALYWKDLNIGFVIEGQKYCNGPFVEGRNREAMLHAVREHVWRKGNELELGILKSGDYASRGAGRFTLNRLHDLGTYVGEPDPKAMAARLRGSSATVLIRGPSGSGKSVFARHVARHARGNQRVLKVSGHTLMQCMPSEVEDLVRVLHPEVLVLDDVESGYATTHTLDLLERLRLPHTMVFITTMTHVDNLEPGSWYTPGIRPGRIDEFLFIPFPDDKARRLLLTHYAEKHRLDLDAATLSGLVKESKNFTGAYIENLVGRLSAYGVHRWKEEITSLQYVARPEREEVTPKKKKPKARKKRTPAIAGGTP
jgi:hypothetical protein